MYALPELAPITAAWWKGVRLHVSLAGGPLLPEVSEHDGDEESLWLSPTLALAQSCGYPLTHRLAGKVRYVATFCHGVPGCHGADYSSLILVHDDDPAASPADLRGYRAAINSWDSHSGMNALRHAVAAFATNGRFFGEVQVSGSHRASLARLRCGQADVAAVDCVTYALLGTVAPEELRGLRVLARSAAAPGLPLITRGAAPPAEIAALRRGLASALADPDLEPLRRGLLLTGMEVLAPDAYGRICVLEREAQAAGYPRLG